MELALYLIGAFGTAFIFYETMKHDHDFRNSLHNPLSKSQIISDWLSLIFMSVFWPVIFVVGMCYVIANFLKDNLKLTKFKGR